MNLRYYYRCSVALLHHEYIFPITIVDTGDVPVIEVHGYKLILHLDGLPTEEAVIINSEPSNIH